MEEQKLQLRDVQEGVNSDIYNSALKGLTFFFSFNEFREVVEKRH